MLSISEPVGPLLKLWLKLISWHPIQVIKLWWVNFWHGIILGKKIKKKSLFLHLQEEVTPLPTKSLPPGVYVQIYRGSMSAAQRANLGVTLDSFKTQGIRGIVWHGFTTEMTPSVFTPLVKLCTDRGLLCLAAFGMGSVDPVGMGTRIGKVALVPGCLAIVLDMEGAWDSGKKTSAVQLSQALRTVAPNAFVLDQPWPEPGWHDGFPWEETAALVDVRAPQEYYNDWKAQYGTARYKKLVPVFATQWERLEQVRLAPKGLVKPRIKTIQGYTWDDILPDLVACLTSNPVLIMWAEPFPSDSTMRGIQVVQKLTSLGFTGTSAVQTFQVQWNKNNPADLIATDNQCGKETAKRLGVVLLFP